MRYFANHSNVRFMLSRPSSVSAQQAPEPPQDEPAKAAPKAKRPRPPHRDGQRSYMGRPIAEVMSYLGADWLFRPRPSARTR